LDGIRAISFLIVFVAHAGWGDVIPGGFGVTVFFFLSGYLITTLLRMEHARTGSVSLRDFYLRRVLRIFPPFYTVLALAVVLTLLGLLPEPLQFKPVAAQFAHLTNYWSVVHGSSGQPAGTAVYWSLAVEEHFYLLFPCLFIAMQRLLAGRLRAQTAVLLALCAAVLAWRCALVFGWHAPMDRTYLATDTRVDSILFGCALAVGANPVLDPPRASPALLRWVLLPLGAAILIFSFLFRAPWFRESFRYTVQGIGLVPIFVAGIREPDFGPFRFLNWRAVRHAGLLSYSLYLVHHVVLYALPEGKLALLPRAFLCLGVALAIAESIHRAIEKPCARLRRRLAHAQPAPERPAEPTPGAGLADPG
jgi:peptidoglycan/LPS O-acetylase OafA/YrhL